LVITDNLNGNEKAVSDFFARLAREKKPYVLFSDKPNWEGQWFVPRGNQKELTAQVARFLQVGVTPRSSAPGKSRQILIIEDSTTLRNILRRALEKGFPNDTIREATEGREALAEMSQRKVDLIITDLEMPGMDGQTFLTHLKSNPLLSKKPVLVFSSNLTAELREQLQDLPKVRCLAKPASQERIIEEVSALLGDPRLV
jgi:CheY-like chemotaxis protein